MRLALAVIVKDELKLCEKIANKYAGYFNTIYFAVDNHFDKFEEMFDGRTGVRLIKYNWINDFSHKRNFLAEQIDEPYYVRIDTDDIIESPENINKILEYMVNENIDIVYTPYIYAKDANGNCIAEHWRETFIRKTPNCYWKKAVHENIFINDKNKFKGIKDNRIRIIHNVDEKHAEKSSERNIKILLDEFNRDGENADPRTIAYIGRMLMGIGQWGKAITFLNIFINKSGWDEDKYFAYVQISHCFLQLGRLEDAISACNEAFTIKTEYPDAYLSLCEIYVEKQEFDKAIHWGNIGVSKPKPDTLYVLDPSTYTYKAATNLSMAYFGKGDIDKAKALIDQAKKMCPDNQFIDTHAKLLDKIQLEKNYLKNLIWIKKYLEEVDPDKVNNIPMVITDKTDNQQIAGLKAHLTKEKTFPGNHIVFFCGGSWENWSPKSVDTGIGGSEEAVIYLSKEFVKLGYAVTVYNSCQGLEGKYDGVEYLDVKKFNIKDNFNIFISWRGNVFKNGIVKARKKIVWLHDVPINGMFKKGEDRTFDKILVLSEYHKSLLPEHINKNKVFVTTNGINIEDFKSNGIKRNPKRIIYTSSYDRGVEHLLKIWPEIKEQSPEAELHLFYGWNTYDAMVKQGVRGEKEKADLVALMNQEGVFEHGRVGHKELINEFKQSGIYAYPSHFTEISCISAMKAQACGCVPITTDLAALKETVKSGIKIQGSASDQKTLEAFKASLIDILNNTERQEALRNEVLSVSCDFSWHRVAKEWSEKLFTSIEKRVLVGSRYEWIKSNCDLNKKIVDIGGNKGLIFEGCNRKNITTVDIDLYDVENFVQSDAKKLPFKNKEFEISVLGEICEHVPEPVEVLSEALRVSNKLIVTVPYEQEWADMLKPFQKISKTLEEQGNIDSKTHAKQANPEALEIYNKDNYEHLYHHRYYTKETLKKDIQSAGWRNIEITKYSEGQWAFLGAIAHAE